MVKEHMTKLSDGIFNDEDDVDNDEVFEGDDENEFHIDDDEEDVDDCSALEDEDDEEYFCEEDYGGDKSEQRNFSSRSIKKT